MYIVSSRLEGGPQAILESALTKTPIISTDVGIASSISGDSIFDDNRITKTQLQMLIMHLKKFKIQNRQHDYSIQ